ncbi:MAG: DUF1800 domain-containing protein [Pseudomonadota bacterium]|nr:DUF1800 domain-containing protein [Pseudomonadota bacterium]
MACLVSLHGAPARCADLPPTPWINDLTPIAASDWTTARAAHLLERAGFGATPEEIERSYQLGAREAVRQLVHPQGPEDPGVRAFEPSGIPDQGIDPFPDTRPAATDAAKARGEALGVQAKPSGNRRLQPVVDKFFFWVRASLLECNRIAYWWADRMLRTRHPLVEKMALFWHGHFATHEDKVRDWRKMLQQLELFQRQGLGNFRSLMIAVAQDPAMLAFLDAGVNVKGRPNENFAREIMEMFTMGVGHYSEHDIREAARAFTGWNYEGARFVVRADQHDDGDKEVFGQHGAFDGVQVIDLILQQPATADYLAGRIYRYLVREEADAATVHRLGEVLRANHYDIAPLLETILLSRDFYSSASTGTRIKSPVELVVGTYHRLGLHEIPGMPDFNEVTRALGQHLLHPPTVAGWAYGAGWITPGLLMERGNFAHDVLFPDFLAPSNDRYPQINVGPEVRAVHERLRRGMDVSAATLPPGEASAGAAMAESTRKGDRDEDFNTRYGSYRGWQQAVQVIRPIPRTMANPDLSALVEAAHARTSTEVVDLFATRFFSVPASVADRAAWTAFLTERLGTDRIERARSYMEEDLRALLHAMLSSPDYQLN